MSVPSSSRGRTSSLGGAAAGLSSGGEARRVRPAHLAVAGPSSTSDPMATSSGANSQIALGSGQPSRADQIVYRFYLKTVSVLVDGRVTHFNKGERKKDRWVREMNRGRKGKLL